MARAWAVDWRRARAGLAGGLVVVGIGSAMVGLFHMTHDGRYAPGSELAVADWTVATVGRGIPADGSRPATPAGDHCVLPSGTRAASLGVEPGLGVLLRVGAAAGRAAEGCPGGSLVYVGRDQADDALVSAAAWRAREVDDARRRAAIADATTRLAP